MNMKAINSEGCNEDGAIYPDVTSLDLILKHIDKCNGRNDALRAYIYALRDLQWAHNEFAAYGTVEVAVVDQAEAAVREASVDRCRVFIE